MADYVDKFNFYNESGGLEQSVPVRDSATASTLANLQNAYNNYIYRGILVVADSYGTGYLITGGSTTPYTEGFTASAVGADFYDYVATNGAGFVESETQTFLQSVQSWVSTHSSDVSKITEIWVVGGQNDKGQSASSINTAVTAFNSYIHTTFPNLKRRCLANLGVNTNTGEMPTILTTYYYQQRYAALRGWAIYDLNGAIPFTTLIADTVHPNQTGQDNIRASVISLLSGGTTLDFVSASNRPFTPGTGLGAGLNALFRVSGRRCFVRLSGSIQIPESWNLTPLTLNIGTMSKIIPVDYLQFSGYISVPVITTSFATTTLALPAVFSLTSKNDSTWAATLGCGMGFGYSFQNAGSPNTAIGTLGGECQVYMESKTLDIFTASS